MGPEVCGDRWTGDLEESGGGQSVRWWSEYKSYLDPGRGNLLWIEVFGHEEGRDGSGERGGKNRSSDRGLYRA